MNVQFYYIIFRKYKKTIKFCGVLCLRSSSLPLLSWFWSLSCLLTRVGGHLWSMVFVFNLITYFVDFSLGFSYGIYWFTETSRETQLYCVFNIVFGSHFLAIKSTSKTLPYANALFVYTNIHHSNCYGNGRTTALQLQELRNRSMA